MTLPLESDQFFNGVTMEWTLRFVWNDRPWTLNEAHNGKVNRWAANARIAEWRTALRLMSEGCPRLAYCDVTVDHVVGTQRSVDTVACAPAYKAALDGLRDWTDDHGLRRYAVLPDDNPTYVRDVTFHPPTYEKGRDALIITLVGPAAPLEEAESA